MKITLNIPACISKHISLEEDTCNAITSYALKTLGVLALATSVYVFSGSLVALSIGGVVFAVCWIASHYLSFAFPEKEVAWNTLLNLKVLGRPIRDALPSTKEQYQDRLKCLPCDLLKRFQCNGPALLFLIELEPHVAALFSEDHPTVDEIAKVYLKARMDMAFLRNVAWCKEQDVPVLTCCKHSLVLPKERPPEKFCPREGTDFAWIAFVLKLYHTLEVPESVNGLTFEELESIHEQMKIFWTRNPYKYFPVLFEHREILGLVNEEFFEFFPQFVDMGGMTDGYFANTTVALETRAEALCLFAAKLRNTPKKANRALRIMKIYSEKYPQVRPDVLCGNILTILWNEDTDQAIADRVGRLLKPKETPPSNTLFSPEELKALSCLTPERLEKILAISRGKTCWPSFRQLLLALVKRYEGKSLVDYVIDNISQKGWSPFWVQYSEIIRTREVHSRLALALASHVLSPPTHLAALYDDALALAGKIGKKPFMSKIKEVAPKEGDPVAMVVIGIVIFHYHNLRSMALPESRDFVLETISKVRG